MTLKLVIPMSGLGSRFLDAGYTDPKPLISVGGRPIIEWVLQMFPGVDDVLFICRKEHIETTPLQSVLYQLRPNSSIAIIEGAKRGPVDALMKARDSIPDESPIMVSYCDYYMRWNFLDFQKSLQSENPVGAVPCYTGFHPHLIPKKNVYASCRVNENNQLLAIQEKHSFEPDKSKGFHSPGAYYFSSGKVLKHYSDQLMHEGHDINGEYYVSMLYSDMIKDGFQVNVYSKIDHFCQWGTPEDLSEYRYWMQCIQQWSAHHG